jgi:hypothetical protein
MRWKEIARTGDTVTKVHLEGMSDRSVAELASLARSWESPAVLKVESPGYSGGDYDPGERAWIVERSAAAGTEPLALTLAASPDSPVENVALVVKGWGDAGATLTLDGREVAGGKDFRVGHRRRHRGDRPRRLRYCARHLAAPAGPRAPLSRPTALPVQLRPLAPVGPRGTPDVSARQPSPGLHATLGAHRCAIGSRRLSHVTKTSAPAASAQAR